MVGASPPGSNEERNLDLAQRFVDGVGMGQAADEIASLFASDVSFEVPGQAGLLPWIGRRTGSQAAAEFVVETRKLFETLKFEVDEILASDSRAVIIGNLASRFRSNGQVVETPFAIILTIGGDRIVRFQMLEDSFAVSRAAGAA